MHTRKSLLVPCILFIGVLTACSQEPDISRMTEVDLLEYARGIHERVLTLDAHYEIPYNFATEEVDPGDPDTERQFSLPKMREGGVDAGFFIVLVDQGDRTPVGYGYAYEQALRKFDAIHRMAEDMYPDQIEIAYHPDDVMLIHESGKLVAGIGIENGWSIGKDLSKLHEFYDRGGRFMALVHFGHNDICDSSNPAPDDVPVEHNGVSEFGEQVIAEMNRLGMLIDMSHASKQSMLDAAELSKAPIIVSHSGIAAVNIHLRNIDDEQLLALRENGGIINVVAIKDFVKTVQGSSEYERALQVLRDEFNINTRDNNTILLSMEAMSKEERARYDERLGKLAEEFPPPPSPNLDDYMDHIDHVANLIGVDHIGITADFSSPGAGGVEGWEDAGESFNVTLALVKRGYSEEEIQKMWSGNFLRVWKEAERVAEELKKGTHD